MGGLNYCVGYMKPHLYRGMDNKGRFWWRCRLWRGDGWTVSYGKSAITAYLAIPAAQKRKK